MPDRKGSALAELTTLQRTDQNIGLVRGGQNYRYPLSALGFGDILNVKSYGAVGDGVADDVTEIQDALDDVPATGGIVFLPPGTYKCSTTLFIKSGTTLAGSGWLSKLNFTGLAVETLTTGPAGIRASANNNTDMIVRDLLVDTSSLAIGNKCIAFYASSRTRVENVRCITSGQGIIHLNCSDYWVVNNYILATDDLGDGLIDQWYGSHDGHIVGNIVDGGSIARYGVLATGSNTGATLATPVYNLDIRGNTFRNITQPSIYLQGGLGRCHHIVVDGNVVQGSSVNYGILVEDTTCFSIINNNVRDTALNGIRLRQSTGNPTTGPRNGVISGNVVDNANTTSNGSADLGAGIALGSSGDAEGIIVSNNVVSGTTHTYALAISAGCDNNLVQGNKFTAGVTGAIINAGASNIVTESDVLWATYTPTLTNIANIDSSTAFNGQYMRVGALVTVSGQVTIDTTASATDTRLGISLPIASNFDAAQRLGGTAVSETIAGAAAAIKGDPTNDRAELRYVSNSTASSIFYFTFTYRII